MRNYKSNRGEVKCKGRIGALLELGSGFNPEFTGRENIILNGLILGLTKKEIQEKMEGILGFADIGEFIEQPVKTYSSGMAVRLAFAVQASIDPDILVVDEALAVGDELFQRKCFKRLETLKNAGTSILLVSHSAAQINRHCDRAIWIDRGGVVAEGYAKRVVNAYQMYNGEDWKKNKKDISEIVEGWETRERIKNEINKRQRMSKVL